MIDLKTLSAAELTARYNELTGKSIKAGSYSKAVLAQMIEALEATLDLSDIIAEKDAKEAAHKASLKDPVEDDTFTLADLARSLGINPKIARSRYRAVDNDGARTQYVFPISRRDEVAKIISPKRPRG